MPDHLCPRLLWSCVFAFLRCSVCYGPNPVASCPADILYDAAGPSVYGGSTASARPRAQASHSPPRRQARQFLTLAAIKAIPIGRFWVGAGEHVCTSVWLCRRPTPRVSHPLRDYTACALRYTLGSWDAGDHRDRHHRPTTSQTPANQTGPPSTRTCSPHIWQTFSVWMWSEGWRGGEIGSTAGAGHAARRNSWVSGS